MMALLLKKNVGFVRGQDEKEINVIWITFRDLYMALPGGSECIGRSVWFDAGEELGGKTLVFEDKHEILPEEVYLEANKALRTARENELKALEEGVSPQYCMWYRPKVLLAENYARRKYVCVVAARESEAADAALEAGYRPVALKEGETPSWQEWAELRRRAQQAEVSQS